MRTLRTLGICGWLVAVWPKLPRLPRLDNSRSADRKLKPLPPDLPRHQDSAIARQRKGTVVHLWTQIYSAGAKGIASTLFPKSLVLKVVLLLAVGPMVGVAHAAGTQD